MVPDILHLRNFMCYGEDVPPLRFDGLNIVCLSGHNGAGKSALLDAITWALWGKARAKSDDDLIMLGREEMEVALEFRLGAQRYRVVRRRKKGRRGQTLLDFQLCDASGTWRRLTGDTLAETQAAINATLRLEYDTFINSAFLVQGRADEFTMRKPAERKQVLADILGLEQYDLLERRARDEANRLSKDLDIVQSQITTLQVEVEQRPLYEQALSAAQERVALLQEQVDDHQANLAELQAHSARLREVGERRDAVLGRLAQLEQERRTLGEQIAATRATIERYEAIIAQREAIEAGLAERQQVQQRLDHLEALREEHQRLLEEYRVWEQRLLAQRHALELELRAARERLRQLEAHLERRAALLAERDSLLAQSEQARALEAERDELRRRERALSERLAEALKLGARMAELQGQINVQRDSLIASLEEQRRRADALTAVVDQLPALEAELRAVDAELAQLVAIDQELTLCREEVAQLAQRLGELQAEAKGVEAEGRAVKEKLELAQQGEAACPVCGSVLGADGLARLIAEYEDQRAALRARLVELRRELRDAEARREQQHARIAELEQRRARRAALQGQQGRLEQQIAQAREAREALADVLQTLETLQQQLDQRDYAHAQQAELARCVAQHTALGSSEVIEAELRDLQMALNQVEAQVLQSEQHREQMRQIEAELATIAAALVEHPATQAEVATLERRLRDEDYGAEERRQMETIRAQGLALGYDRKEHEALRERRAALQAWEQQARELERALYFIEREREQLRRDQVQQARIEADLAAQQRELGVLEEQLRDKPALDAALREAFLRGQVLQRQLAEAQAALGRAQADLERCLRQAEELTRQRARAEALRDEQSVYEELAQAFGKKGVQAMLIETAIPELEQEANRLLARMTDNQFHLEFVTQRSAKSSDSTIETLEIRIADGMGTRDYQMFSGGEAFRVNFAIRIALAKLLARRAGANLRTLIIDEGFGSQDNVGRDRVVEAINAIGAEFERILVITHIQELKDMFEAQIEIRKTPQGSLWSVV
ncbi:AAA family ATPase [Kallotenue papyrolyticum]|uniref:AAA family ATPase n=1 Tax=Kallotenue papyrolyticum TaxID=1325125 RepID=UPI0004785D35|nr:SMC family ATPase [Kallotenue papyrolyticum]